MLLPEKLFDWLTVVHVTAQHCFVSCHLCLPRKRSIGIVCCDQTSFPTYRSLKVKANAVGWDHDDVATAYMNLSSLHVHKEDYVTAEQFIRKAMAIQEVGDHFEYRV